MLEHYLTQKPSYHQHRFFEYIQKKGQFKDGDIVKGVQQGVTGTYDYNETYTWLVGAFDTKREYTVHYM